MRKVDKMDESLKSAFVPHPKSGTKGTAGKELFDTSFNAAFNLLIEVIVLTVAFIIFFAKFQEDAINAPVADLIYDSRKAELAQGVHAFLKNDPTDLPSVLANLPSIPSVPTIPGSVPGVPTMPGVPTRPEDGSDGVWVWDQLLASAPWDPRYSHAAVGALDGTIVLTGGMGTDAGSLVWLSRDSGFDWETAGGAAAGFGVRHGHRMATLPNGNIVMTGGTSSGVEAWKGDVWQSPDGGMSWELVLAEAPWAGRLVRRSDHGLVVLADGSLVLVGGMLDTVSAGDLSSSSSSDGDVWRSPDGGVSWLKLGTVAPGVVRSGHALVSIPGTQTVLLIGGFGSPSSLNSDVWRSPDGGVSWQRIVANAPWEARDHHQVVVMGNSGGPGELLLMGGVGERSVLFRDVWRSRDGGASWGLLTRNAPWSGRARFAAISTARNDVILMGGQDWNRAFSDVWRLRNIASRTQDGDEVSVSAASSVELRTRILQRFILSLADPDPNNNAVAVHNVWVKRAAIILMAMGLVAGLVAIFVYRTAVPNAKDRVNLPRILALNLIIFFGTFAIQGVFMLFFTLRYIPIKPSLQLETLRDRFNVRADEALLRNEQPVPTFREGEDLIPTSALVGNGIILGMVVVVVLVVYLAWRKRAFQKVSLGQAAFMGCITVGLVIIGMYFFVQRTYAPKIVERVSDELAKAVVDKTVAAFPDKQEFERFREWVSQTFDAQIENMQKTTNVSAEARNVRLVDSMVKIAGAVLAVLVLYIVAIQWYRNKHLPRDRRQSWGSFVICILLVGLVAGTTSVLVEFGFANNILTNYISTNPGKLVNNTILNMNASIEKHKEWFLDKRCVAEQESCPADAMSTLRQMEFVGPGGDGNYDWFRPRKAVAGDGGVTECEFKKRCDVCCDNGPYLYRFDRDVVSRSARIKLPSGIDLDRLKSGDTIKAPCTTAPDGTFAPICPDELWDEERGVCLQREDVFEDCSEWESYTRNGNKIWKRHVALDL